MWGQKMAMIYKIIKEVGWRAYKSQKRDDVILEWSPMLLPPPGPHKNQGVCSSILCELLFDKLDKSEHAHFRLIPFCFSLKHLREIDS